MATDSNCKISDAAIKESFSGNYFGLGGNSIFPYANSTANTTG